jgi:hypothetical protein
MYILLSAFNLKVDGSIFLACVARHINQLINRIYIPNFPRSHTKHPKLQPILYCYYLLYPNILHSLRIDTALSNQHILHISSQSTINRPINQQIRVSVTIPKSPTGHTQRAKLHPTGPSRGNAAVESRPQSTKMPNIHWSKRA